MDEQKQLGGKDQYFNRVDVGAMISPVAKLRKQVLEEIKKYPESMSWPDITPEQFIDAIQRHLDVIGKEGDPFAIDPETECPHFFAIGFNYMVLSMKYHGRERDLHKE